MGGRDSSYLTACCSDGVEYSLYDNVKVFEKNFTEPHIGKITQFWEDEASQTKKVSIRWFLRHKEVKPQADDNPKELFLAFGEGKGVVNENDLDVIIGKCKVLCTSKDPRNSQPSISDIENSDYYFSHVYDVDLELTSPIEEFVETLGLNAILNKQECVTERSKIAEKANDPQKSETPKDGAKKVLQVGSTGTEINKVIRDVEKVSNSRRIGVSQEGDVKKGQLSSDESWRRSKIKSSEGIALLEEEGCENLTNPSTGLPCQGLNTGDAIRKASQVIIVESHASGGQVSPGKVERGLGTSSEECAKRESIALEKKNSIQEIFILPNTTVDSPKQHAIDDSPRNGINLQQATDTAKLDEKAPDKESAFSKDTQKLEVMDGLNVEETNLGFMGEEQCSRLLSKRARSDTTEIVEAERGQIVDLAKDGRSNISKKMKMGTSVETEKRPMSTVEIVRTTEKRKIFKKLPWEESLEQGLSNGKVLLLQNFDPWTTSADVRDLLESTFHGLLDARVLPQESICPSVQALAIFETKVLADTALEAMEMKCLVLTDSKRPVVATRVKESASQFRFPGHLALDKLKLGKSVSSEEYKKAVSTSHSSQPNTIEFDMAMEWRQLQEITQNCRLELFKKQRKEINDLRSRNLSKAQKSKRELL